MKNRALYLFSTVFAAALTVVPASAQKDMGANVRPGSAGQDRIAREVRHQLVMLPYYSVFDNLAFRVEGSVVTLYGQVVLPVLKSDAENVVKSVEGVAQVKNEIQVLPLSPMDDQSRRAEYRAIYGFADLYRYAQQAVPSIHIIVDNGKVTLVGVVDSAADKNLAGLRANTVSGVFSVTNDLVVQSR
jgi:hyperosmotically inducible protein